MAYLFQSTIRILARHENRSISVFRKCSSQELSPKSPIVVPRITIKGNNSFGNKTTRPSPKVAACIMLQGKPNNFQDSEELIEGSLHAIELITQTLSKTQDLQNSDLVEYTTEQCFKQIMSMYSGSEEYENFKKGKSEKFSGSVINGKNIDSKDVEEFFQKLEQHMHKAQKFARENCLILKEDIFFSWIENMNPEKTQMRIGTMSFPHLGEILNKIEQIEDKQERMKYIESVFPDINMNSVVCCNWDFNKVEEDWTLDGMHIGPLPLIQFKWKFRLMIWLRTMPFLSKKFVDILRFDYVTDTMVAVPIIGLYLTRILFF